MAAAAPPAAGGAALQKQHAGSLELGRAAIRRQHPSSLSARRGRPLPWCDEFTFWTLTRHRAPDQQPGGILIPGDGAAGDQGAQDRPAYPAMAPTRRLRPAPPQQLPGAMVSGAPAALRPAGHIDLDPHGKTRLGYRPSRSRTATNGHIVFGSNNLRSPTMSGCRRRVTAWVLRADAPVLCGLLAEWRALIANMTLPEVRVPPAEAEIERLFAGWREELAIRRKFVPAARNYAAAAGGRRRPAGQRDPHARPGRRALGAGPVRQAERPPRQGSTTPRPQAAAGAADQRR
jgi:hypothetical protein